MNGEKRLDWERIKWGLPREVPGGWRYALQLYYASSSEPPTFHMFSKCVSRQLPPLGDWKFLETKGSACSKRSIHVCLLRWTNKSYLRHSKNLGNWRKIQPEKGNPEKGKKKSSLKLTSASSLDRGSSGDVNPCRVTSFLLKDAASRHRSLIPLRPLGLMETPGWQPAAWCFSILAVPTEGGGWALYSRDWKLSGKRQKWQQGWGIAECQELARASQVAPVVRICLPTQEMPGMQVQSLGCEDHLEEGMATHLSILAWRIPMDRGAWRTTIHRVAKSQTQLKWLSMHGRTHTHTPENKHS